MARLTSTSDDVQTNDVSIYAYHFDSDDDTIKQKPRKVKQICISDCIYDGTYETLQNIQRRNKDCYVLLLCYTNHSFDIKCDAPVKSTDTQIGCITATINDNVLKTNDSSKIMQLTCVDKVGKFSFKVPPDVMYNANSNYIIASNVKNMMKYRDIDSLQSFRHEHNEKQSYPARNIEILRSGFGSKFNPSPKSGASDDSPKEGLSNLPPPGFGFDELPKNIPTFENKRKKQKTTSIIYGTLSDMQTFLYNCSGKRSFKKQREIKKLHVVPIYILLDFIKQSSSIRYQTTEVWHLSLFNEWLKEN